VAAPPASSVTATSAPAVSAARKNAASPHPHQHAAVAGATTAGAFVAVSFVGFALWALARRAKARRRDATALAMKRDSLASAAAMATMARSPREFPATPDSPLVPCRGGLILAMAATDLGMLPRIRPLYFVLILQSIFFLILHWSFLNFTCASGLIGSCLIL
jgi:hypothetical protein